MTDIPVWPRLPRGRAIELWRALSTVPAVQARLSARTEHRIAAPAPWGSVVTEERIADVQVELRSVGDAAGWPKAIGANAFASVDRAWGRVLFERMTLAPADAAGEGPWSFLALVVVPDLALWRFPAGSRDRFIGLGDHVFARLWWREFCLGSEIMEGDGHQPLTEEELAALFRRRDLVANPTVARAIGRGILRLDASGAERLARLKSVLLDLLRLTPGLCLDALGDIELDELLAELLLERKP